MPHLSLEGLPEADKAGEAPRLLSHAGAGGLLRATWAGGLHGHVPGRGGHVQHGDKQRRDYHAWLCIRGACGGTAITLLLAPLQPAIGGDLLLHVSADGPELRLFAARGSL